jgi:hypothetical protein
VRCAGDDALFWKRCVFACCLVLHSVQRRRKVMAAAFFNDLSNKIGSIFGTGDSLPWTDEEMILVSSLFCFCFFFVSSCSRSRSSLFVLWFSLRGVFSLFFGFLV